MVEPYVWGFWGPNCYLISGDGVLDTVIRWLIDNDVDHRKINSGKMKLGQIIQVRGDDTLFRMRWL